MFLSYPETLTGITFREYFQIVVNILNWFKIKHFQGYSEILKLNIKRQEVK
jgi:hypothetical protein